MTTTTTIVGTPVQFDRDQIELISKQLETISDQLAEPREGG